MAVNIPVKRKKSAPVQTERYTYWPSKRLVLPPALGAQRHLAIRVTDRATQTFELRRMRLRQLTHGKHLAACSGPPLLRGDSGALGYLWTTLMKLGFVLHLEQPKRPAW